MPVVPCAQATTGRPPLGGFPSGATTMPDTAMSSPRADFDLYRTRHAFAPAGAVIGSERMSVPGLPLGSGSGVA